MTTLKTCTKYICYFRALGCSLLRWSQFYWHCCFPFILFSLQPGVPNCQLSQTVQTSDHGRTVPLREGPLIYSPAVDLVWPLTKSITQSTTQSTPECTHSNHTGPPWSLPDLHSLPRYSEWYIFFLSFLFLNSMVYSRELTWNKEREREREGQQKVPRGPQTGNVAVSWWASLTPLPPVCS